MKKNLLNLNYYFLFLLIIFIPLQGLFSNVLEAHFKLFTESVFWLSHWYEPILITLLLLTVIIRLFNKFNKLSLMEWTAIVLIVLGLLASFLYEPVNRAIEGFRFSLLGVLIFLLSFWSNFDDKKKSRLLNTYLLVSFIIALWALVEKVLPAKYWSEWSVLPSDLLWGYGWHSIGGINQVASVLGGPNQLASFLLPAFFLFLFRSWETFSRKIDKIFYLNAISTFFTGVVILLTFSRSAAVGLLFGLFLIPFLTGKSILIKRVIVAFAIILSFLIIFLYKQNNPIVTHGASQTGHILALSQGYSEISDRLHNDPIKLMVGTGLGTAGPLALKYQDGFMPESWYLQLLLEIGLTGLILWLAFIYLILLNLFKQQRFALVLGLISVSVTALFLHTWADNPAMAYTFFILLGITISINIKTKKGKRNEQNIN